MKKVLCTLIILSILLSAISMGALASEITSNSIRVHAQERPEEPSEGSSEELTEQAGAEANEDGAGETEAEAPKLSEMPVPEDIPNTDETGEAGTEAPELPEMPAPEDIPLTSETTDEAETADVPPEDAIEAEITDALPETEEAEQPENLVLSSGAYEYQRDETGNLVLDEMGNPIPVLPEGATVKPVAWQLDENGNLVLDENGNPIVIQELPIEAEQINSWQDEINPNCRADIYIAWADETKKGYGQSAVLTAVLVGYDNLVYSLQWQVSKNGSSFEDVSGATGSVYVTTVTEDNVNDQWRVAITITDALDRFEGDEQDAA